MLKKVIYMLNYRVLLLVYLDMLQKFGEKTSYQKLMNYLIP